MNSDEVRQYYADRVLKFNKELEVLSTKSSRLSNIRLLLFVIVVVTLSEAIFGNFPLKWLWILCGVLSLISFITVILHHNSILKKRERASEMSAINRESLHRLNRAWAELDVSYRYDSNFDTSLADDLDIFGKASLFQLLGTVNTSHGKKNLADWLLNPAESSVISSRQEAVKELAGEREFSQEMNFLSRELSRKDPDLKAFLSWLKSNPVFSPQFFFMSAIRLLSGLTCILVLVQILGFLPAPLWLFTVVINLVVTAMYVRHMHKVFSHISLGDRAFSHYANLFRLLAAKEFKSEKLRSLISGLTISGLSAYKQMRELDKIVNLSNLRLSGMLYFPVQVLTLWDFHIYYRLLNWKSAVGSSVSLWLKTLGEIETLLAMGTLNHDHPEWCFPEITNDGSSKISAEKMGHPLLYPEKCVTNSLEIGPQGTFLLVTGSNMSGKSTLLRSLGVNVVLAQAGCPVFASSFSLPSLRIGTCIRIRDSLSDGVSYFMAELKQLKKVMSLAGEALNDSKRIVLYLLDEILMGTNIVERQIAVKQVIHNLLDSGAIGAIATHDLSIAEAKELKGKIQSVHFREEFEEKNSIPHISFDYRLRPGIAPTTNALKLLKMVGL